MLILRGNPPPKAAGPFASLLDEEELAMIELFLGALVLVVAIMGLMLYFFFFRKGG